MKYIRILLVALLPVIAMQITAQEVCGNGIDDDGDGLIDIYDPDCCYEDSYLSYLFCTDTCSEEIIIEEDLQLEVIEEQLQPDYWSAINVPVVYTKIEDNTSRSYIVGRNEVEDNRNHNSLSIITLTDNTRKIDIDKIHRWGVPYGVVNLGTELNPDIIIVIATSDDADEQRKLIAYREDGSIFWISSEQYTPLDSYDAAVIGFADFNEDGVPEVYCGPTIFDMRNGAKVAGLSDFSLSIGVQSRPNYDMSMIASAIDIIPSESCSSCAGLELLSGNTIYTVDIASNTLTPYQVIPGTSDGYSIAVTPDNELHPQVFLVHNDENGTYLNLWSPQTESMVYEVQLFDEPQYTSIPIFLKSEINPGQSYIIINSENTVLCYRYNSGSISKLWEIATVDFSGQTGMSLYKYASNKEPVILHRGQEMFRLIDVTDGHIMWETACRSSTNIEFPVAISLDDEDRASILCSCGGDLKVFKPTVRTLPSQKHWNQFLFDNVNINPDLSVPQVRQKKNQLSGNYHSIMLPLRGDKLPVPDMQLDETFLTCESGSIRMNINFRKSNLASWPDSIVCYVVNPVNSDTITRKSLKGLLSQDLTGFMTVDLGTTYLEKYLLLFNTTSESPDGVLSPQCGSEALSREVFYYLSQYDILPDTLQLCSREEVDFQEPSVVLNYNWEDGENMLDRSFSQSGIYVLSYLDACGVLYSDSIYIAYDEIDQIDITELSYCKNPFQESVKDTLCFNLRAGIAITSASVGYKQEGRSVCVFIGDEHSVEVFSENVAQCPDTTSITLVKDIMPSSIHEEMSCFGSEIRVFGMVFTEDTLFYHYESGENCDSVVQVNLEFEKEAPEETITLYSCKGAEIEIDGISFDRDTLYETIELSPIGCVLLKRYDLHFQDTILESYIEETGCIGEEIQIGGLSYRESTRDTIFSTSTYGCDSITYIDVSFRDTIIYDLEVSNSCNGSPGAVELTLDSYTVANWADGSQETYRSLVPGDYSITLTKVNNCEVVIPVRIESVSLMWPEIEIDSQSCPGINDGRIEVMTSGTQVAYIYEDEVLVAEDIYLQASEEHNYRVTLYDRGCTQDSVVQLPVLTEIDVAYRSVIHLDEFDTIEIAPIVIDEEQILSVFWRSSNMLLCDTCLQFQYVGKESEVLHGLFTSTNGCVIEKDIEIVVKKGQLLYIPNSFTPNGDGTNDSWVVYPGTQFAKILSINVFNRWGDRVYSNKDLRKTNESGIKILTETLELSPSVLSYRMVVQDRYGEDHLFYGTVTLLK